MDTCFMGANSTPTTGVQICQRYNMTAVQFANLPLAERALFRAAYAADVLKVREVPEGSNRGPDVDRYIRSAGFEPPQYWCAAFWYCMLKDSGADAKDLPNHPASVHGWLDWARKGGHLVARPKRTAVGLIIETPATGHLIVCSSVLLRTVVNTIEGNTNNNGSRNGYGVFRRTRASYSIDYWVDLGWLK